jgi:hypothetical protein
MDSLPTCRRDSLQPRARSVGVKKLNSPSPGAGLSNYGYRCFLLVNLSESRRGTVRLGIRFSKMNFSKSQHGGTVRLGIVSLEFL